MIASDKSLQLVIFFLAQDLSFLHTHNRERGREMVYYTFASILLTVKSQCAEVT